MVFLHYVFDLWIQWWREKRCSGKVVVVVVVVRYADDFVIGFESKDEAEACLGELRTRFAKFGLKLHETKTLAKCIETSISTASLDVVSDAAIGSLRVADTESHCPYPDQRFRDRLKAGAV
jgi:Reverse transcriptase (RNA-dependent DNA polymerase)